MAEIIPAINAADFNEVKRRIELAARRARLIHIDVADGTFTPSKTWFNPADFGAYDPLVQIELHFMVADPEKKISEWLMSQIKRIIFHIEAAVNPYELVAKCHSAGCEAGIAIKPDTPWGALRPFVDLVDLLQILAVSPGPSGQQFDVRSLEKIAALRVIAPKKIIEVDGGIKLDVARKCARAGADLLVAGSALFGPGVDFYKAFDEMNHDIAAVDS